MSCSSPIWIRNRRYFDHTRTRSFDPHDDQLSALALAPYDVARRFIAVPCGRCKECLRQLRNDWFVRLDRELSYQKKLGNKSVFVTITINPKYYQQALASPASFIRSFNERIRHRFGKSVRHAFFQEFGTHPEFGNEPRLHFHGFLFNVVNRYNDIRAAIGDLGYIWISNSSHRRARYVVKYVVKQLEFDPRSVENLYITTENGKQPLSVALLDRRYTRKFISPHVGDYLGDRPRPSYDTSSWSYFDFKTRTHYNYRIPRYYDRYLSEEDAQARSIRSAASYARLSSNGLLRSIVSQCFKLNPKTSALSLNSSYSRCSISHRRLAAACPNYAILPPAKIPRFIVDFWFHNFNISLNYG